MGNPMDDKATISRREFEWTSPKWLRHLIEVKFKMSENDDQVLTALQIAPEDEAEYVAALETLRRLAAKRCDWAFVQKEPVVAYIGGAQLFVPSIVEPSR